MLTTPDGKIYNMVQVRWDGEDVLLDEGNFTLSYGFNVTMSATDENNDDDDDTSLADIKKIHVQSLLLLLTLLHQYHAGLHPNYCIVH